MHLQRNYNCNCILIDYSCRHVALYHSSTTTVVVNFILRYYFLSFTIARLQFACSPIDVPPLYRLMDRTICETWVTHLSIVEGLVTIEHSRETQLVVVNT